MVISGRSVPRERRFRSDLPATVLPFIVRDVTLAA
jgi:hypothetical protein